MAPQPSQRLLRLLDTELPWATSLDTPTIPDPIIHRHPPDLDAAIAHRRLHPDLLDDRLRATLTRANHLHNTIHAAYQRRLNATWIRQCHHRSRSLEEDRGIEL